MDHGPSSIAATNELLTRQTACRSGLAAGAGSSCPRSPKSQPSAPSPSPSPSPSAPRMQISLDAAAAAAAAAAARCSVQRADKRMHVPAGTLGDRDGRRAHSSSTCASAGDFVPMPDARIPPSRRAATGRLSPPARGPEQASKEDEAGRGGRADEGRARGPDDEESERGLGVLSRSCSRRCRHAAAVASRHGQTGFAPIRAMRNRATPPGLFAMRSWHSGLLALAIPIWPHQSFEV
ncbi:hypothetical protein CDD83_1545 [Cordyceps sp. RAO-2017]|nr:hypothetical protein CDD83_1545 [Cordyceps sp. RAO-2017]